MNLFQFLNETDRITSQLSRKELEDFVHNLARVLPEKDRSTFLSQLKSYKYSKFRGRKPERNEHTGCQKDSEGSKNVCKRAAGCGRRKNLPE